jgi:ArsR family transcriptional regulator
MERHYSPGRTWESLTHGLAGLLDLGDVLDIGCGDGAVAELLTPRSRSMTCLDTSERMVAAATERLARFDSARVVHGDMQTLPFRDASFDHAILFNVLVHAASPSKAIAEAARVLRKGGALVVVTLDAHDQEDVAQAWGHVHRGFTPAALRKLLVKTELHVARCEVTARERRPPYFQVVTATTQK